MQSGRRQFLAGCAAIGAGALLPRAWPQRTAPHRIDIHHHLFPKAYIDETSNGVTPSNWTPARSIAEMDAGGIATSVLSVSPPGIWYGNVEQARRLARIVNDYGTQMAKDYPGRFGLFAALPLPDIEGSLREIAYAFDTLKADGIGLFTSYGDKWLGDAAFAPVWEELNRRRAVIYTHPNNPACCTNLNTGVGAGTIEWATDTTRTAASLLFTGTAARYPEIRWILSHGGGTTPFLLSRFQVQAQNMKGKEQRLPNGLMHELTKFYYDTAQANHPGALAALLKLVTPAQILYGTDYPYRTAAEVTGGLSAYGFSAMDLLAIERENAGRLLPRLHG
jgi:predicted TIM-barrel fold metal-dependent hydrolase